MRVLVTGATGLIGGAVGRRLQADGHEVKGLARSEASASKLAAQGLAAAYGDLADPASIASAARSVDAVVQAASPNDQQSAALDEISTRAILEALRGTGKRFLYTSGTLVYGATGDTPAAEERPLAPLALVSWRPALEKEIFAAVAGNVHTVVIRPGWVYGSHGGAAMMMVAAGHEYGVVQHVGSGQNRWSTVHVDDLADLYARALDRGAAGSIYNGVLGAPVRLVEIARAASEAAGISGRVAEWPLDQARLALGPFADAMACDQLVSADKAKRELGWRPSRRSILDELRSYAPAEA
jgi:nucleoside-diphosphate-sugar epimerase